MFHRLLGSFLSDGAHPYFIEVFLRLWVNLLWCISTETMIRHADCNRGRRQQQQSREWLKRITGRPDGTNTSHHFTLSDALDGNVSQGHDVICYKWPRWARSEILGRSNVAVSEMICRKSTTDLAGSCANANCPNYSSGELVDFLAVTSEVALCLAQWVVWPICTVWQDGAPMGPEELSVELLFCFVFQDTLRNVPIGNRNQKSPFETDNLSSNMCLIEKLNRINLWHWKMLQGKCISSFNGFI